VTARHCNTCKVKIVPAFTQLLCDNPAAFSIANLLNHGTDGFIEERRAEFAQWLIPTVDRISHK
jgi:hypothetical protein